MTQPGPETLNFLNAMGLTKTASLEGPCANLRQKRISIRGKKQ